MNMDNHLVETAKAEELFEEFKEHSVAEFFRKNRQMLGFAGKIRSLTTVVHEYISNSLDACEEAGILPDIDLKIEQLPNDHYKVVVKDNGPGIPPQIVGKALGQLLSGTKFHRYMQQRGQQGIGASACTMFSQMTTGKPIHVISGTGDGKYVECDVSVNARTNTPVVANFVEKEGPVRGITIECEMAEVKYEKSEHSPVEYVKRTALANPHAKIGFTDPFGESFTFPRAHDSVPERPSEVQPHPLGVTTNDLMEMAHHSPARKIASFLTSTFSRFSSSKVEELRTLVPDINLDKAPRELKWAESEAITKAFQQMKWIAPATDAIRPIGEEQVTKALKNVLNPEFIAVRQRKPKVYRGGVPFVVEAAVAYGGGSGRPGAAGVGPDILRFANRAPLLFDGGGCAVTDAVKTIDWKRYDVKDFDNTPISIFVNFVSVFVPYTGAGKQAISNEEEIISEIRYAIMDVARDLQRYVAGKTRDSDRVAKRKAIMRYVHQLSLNLPELAAAGESKDIETKLLELIETKYSASIETEEDEPEKANGEKAAGDSNGNGEEQEE